MISVVICSVKKHLAAQIKSNIDNTIGVPWEAVIIDNTSPSRGITAVYNDGASRASFPILCFVHEDVAFLTQDWGKKIVGYFEADPGLGIVGVAGATYKSKTVAGWMTSVPHFDHYNITHRDPSGKNEKMSSGQSSQEGLIQVITLDGVFLCVPKKVITEIPFDETLLTGFHLYDIDLSWRIAKKYKAAVTLGIDLLHFTEGGDFGDRWLTATMNWHDHYRNELPSLIPGTVVTGNEERTVARFYLKRLRTEKISFRNKLKWVANSDAMKDPALWSYVLLFFVYKFFRPLIKTIKGQKVSQH
jgi:hypothetical protein